MKKSEADRHESTDASQETDRLQDSLELDVFLFGGVPELPEPVYERDYHTNHEVRTTRQPVSRMRRRPTGGQCMGFIEIDLENDELSFSNFIPPPEVDP